jgi:hypothetical protein
MRFGTWNVQNMPRAGSLMTVSRELSRYRLDLVGVQVRWEASGITPRAEWTPFQTHCYSEILVALGIEPGTTGLASRNSDHCDVHTHHFNLE